MTGTSSFCRGGSSGGCFYAACRYDRSIELTGHCRVVNAVMKSNYVKIEIDEGLWKGQTVYGIGSNVSGCEENIAIRYPCGTAVSLFIGLSLSSCCCSFAVHLYKVGYALSKCRWRTKEVIRLQDCTFTNCTDRGLYFYRWGTVLLQMVLQEDCAYTNGTAEGL